MRYVKKIICGYGETADAPGLGPGGRNPVGVQIPLPALYNFIRFGNIECMTIQQKEIIITEQLAVKKEGFAPPRDFSRQVLNLARLLFRHTRRLFFLHSTSIRLLT